MLIVTPLPELDQVMIVIRRILMATTSSPVEASVNIECNYYHQYLMERNLDFCCLLNLDRPCHNCSPFCFDCPCTLRTAL